MERVIALPVAGGLQQSVEHELPEVAAAADDESFAGRHGDRGRLRLCGKKKRKRKEERERER